MRSVIVALLLGVGTLTALGAAIGVAVTRDALNRVHFLAPLSTVGALAVGLAIVIGCGADAMTEGAVAATFVVAVSGPILAHYLARAAFDVDRPGPAER